MTEKRPTHIGFRMPKEEFVLFKKLAESKNMSLGDLTKHYVFFNIHRNYNTEKWQEHFEQEHEKQLNAMSEERKKKA